MNSEDKKVKVCQVASVDLSLRFLLLDQMKYLKERGFEVWGVASGGKWVPEIKSRGISVRTIEIRRKLISPLADFIAFIRLVLFFRKEKFDIVHTHTPKASFLGQLAAVFSRIPIRVNTVHGFYFQDETQRFKKFIFVTLEKIIARCAHLTFTVNREDIETAVKKGISPREKLVYLGDGIDLDRFNPAKFPPEFLDKKKRELGIDPAQRVIGIVARLVKEKGYLDLFEAFKRIQNTFPDTVLLVVGPEEPLKDDRIDRGAVEQYGIKKKVIFLGERVDTEELYAVMDIFVLPSYREGLGISILEASAMSRPVVASNIRGIREAIDDGKTGILVPVRYPEKLAEAIMYLLSNPDQAKKMGEEGRKKVEREFSTDMVFTRLEGGYQKLIKEKLS